MRILDLFVVASMPIMKVLMLTALGSFLALDRIDVMGESARKQLNNVVFFVFNPALVSSSLAKTVTFESIVLLWFMPFNILLTFIIGTAMGWLLVKITKAPQHIRGLILSCCAAGNVGHLPLIVVPAICREKGSPFGAPDICHTYGTAYASLSMAIGAIYLWSFVYNVVRVSSAKVNKEVNGDDSTRVMKSTGTGGMPSPTLPDQQNYSEPLLPSKNCSISVYTHELSFSCAKSKGTVKVSDFDKTWQYLRIISRKLNLKAIFAPSTTAAFIGFTMGLVPQIRNLVIGGNAPFHVVQDSASLLGDAAIPIVTLIVGGNLLRGLKGPAGICMSLVIGVIAVRYVLLPLLGIVIIKTAVRFGLVHSDPLYQFILLLHYALPPAMNIGTITQLFRAGESECSVIMLWTYGLASISLTLWSTAFLWLVS
ncbi:hypothetical protein ERO13_D03G000500v2 [Gossypium hirsutum]|uniref:Uncharacterized protein n=3 Tax=Gossypium TaxID=3633 RepID=A0A0D2QDF9_GOSRA|nr:protein PIN-LIKES 3 [Gossypium raimondii]XP_012469189.1 protein PIN-LIKES 3 [Gossypium raimondii]XP_016726263.1 protein PIN-LIKES 3 [Gossypium hirsutum]XP_052479864.1 protein PIN-LIKES 3 [Gossypium raimondii]TYH78604.1 hypothetical protein ES332_D03G000700v1 [Gossypium tomentosum]KAG4153597.1 hypothetical protein ERO13_D03G000500v2 [Gossypium hirsutum]KJB17438.1 hypothetical protein B456_003G000900 [Gossypium raimondii]KJB17439.1 hypothetical protein B456_003G000900 [Gossypium raimondii]